MINLYSEKMEIYTLGKPLSQVFNEHDGLPNMRIKKMTDIRECAKKLLDALSYIECADERVLIVSKAIQSFINEKDFKSDSLDYHQLKRGDKS